MYEKEFVKKIGLNIKSLRAKRDWKQSDLADFAQINRVSVGKIERGQQNFRISSICAIAKALNVEPKVLFDVE
jgi:transcriptional regulator with XRE-family HTH domain